MKRVLKAAAIAIASVALLGGASLLFLIQRNLPSSLPPKIPGLSAKVSVAFDDRGVATVTASTVRDALRVQGWLTARERLFQLELQRRLAQGTLAEIFGASLLASDRAHRTLGFDRVASAALPLLPEDERADLVALADGINAFLDARSGRLGLEFTLLGLSPRRFVPSDALLVHLLMCEDLSTSWRRDLALEKLGRVDPAVRRFVTETASPDDVLLVPDAAPPAWPPLPGIGGAPVAALGFGALREEEPRGSNAWAVAGSLSKSGRPLLANDPHLGLTMPGIWLPMRFVIAGRLVEGVTLRLEVFGRHDDGDPLDGAVGQQLAGDAKGKRRLACAGSGDGQEIARLGAEIPHQCPTLPAPQSLGVGRCKSPHPKLLTDRTAA